MCSIVSSDGKFKLVGDDPEDFPNIPEYEDDDYDDSGDDSGDDGSTDAADILVECEARSDRSKISVKGKNLDAGAYYAVVTSGENSAESGSQEPVDDEVEYDFDSNGGDIAEGAVSIAPDFITGENPEVTGEIFLVGGSEPVLFETVSCSLED